MAKGSIAFYSAIVLSSVATATAAPVVIYDGGLSYPITEYTESLGHVATTSYGLAHLVIGH